MKNQDQDTRFQRYDFTPKRSQNKRIHRPHIWPWIVGLIIVVLILTFGIRYVLNTSNQVTNTTKSANTSKGVSKSSNTSNNSTTKANKGTPATDKSAVASQPAKDSDQTVSSPTSSSSFAENHTFNSLQDAKDWANATKPDWSADGYNYWTVNQNSQGFYVLSFTK